MTRGKVSIDPQVADVLHRSTTTGNILTLPAGQLDRALYLATDKVLKTLGGKWDRHVGGHVFPRPIADVLGEALDAGQVLDQKKALEQFFTPDDVVAQVIAMAEIGEGTRVLEPSAGSGQLARAALDKGATVYAVEIDPQLSQDLVNPFDRGSILNICADFMAWEIPAGWEPFDLVLMNPPFSRGQDMAHVLRAFEMLRPTGSLVAIMSPHWVFSTDHASTEFRAFLSELGDDAYAWEDLPDGAFKRSGTSVSTGILHLRKTQQLSNPSGRPALNASVSNGPATLPLAEIRPGANPRRYFDKRKHEELVASLRLRGMLQPILLRPSADTDGVFTIVAGERRHRAAIEAFGPDGEVPVIIREMTDQEALEAAIDENDIRDDASETEQADAAVRVVAACQGDRAEAARRLGWSASKLERRLALANLSDAVKLALDERRIKVGHAELLAVIPGDKQDKALDTILTAGLDVAKTRELLMRVTQSLAGATFDKTECMTCPFNSGSQRALFETHVDDGHCTNPGCFQLKSEAADKARAAEQDKAAEAERAPVPPAGPPAGTCRICGCTEDRACEGPCGWADKTQTLCNNPDCVAKAAEQAKPATPKASPAPSKPASSSAAPAKVTVTTASIANRVGDLRNAAWRAALVSTADSNPELARAFEGLLRMTWRVDKTFLSRFGKDELKFIAQECGLVAHMGEKAFAKLLGSKPAAIVDGMLNAKGFDWAGRLPSAMTLDGKYGPPNGDAAPPPLAPTKKD